MSEWIPCAERMPEIGEDALVYEPGHIYCNFDIAEWVGDYWQEHRECRPLKDVTHWMPLPKAPV